MKGGFIFMLLALTSAAHAIAMGPLAPPSTACERNLDDPAAVDQAYDRFIATSVELEHREATASVDDRLVEGVRREYLAMFGRPLSFVDVATHVLRNGNKHHERLRRAVHAHLRAPERAPPAPNPRSTAREDRSLLTAQSYRGALNLLSRGDAISRGLEDLVKGIEDTYFRLYGRSPDRRSIKANDKFLMHAIDVHLRHSDSPTDARDPVRTRSSSKCFTAHMRVATPAGLREIASLKIGDTVYSYDLIGRRVVTGVVTEVRHTPARAFGRLVDHAVPIEVTGEHRFYAGLDRYEPVARLEPQHALYGLPAEVLRDGLVIDLVPQPRGCYHEDGASATVTEISLGAGPHNYFVEGILVHNAKISG